MCQQVPTSANIVVVPCKRTQQVTTLLGPTVLRVGGQQYKCCVRLHAGAYKFDRFQTIHNKCQQVPTLTVGPSNVVTCCVRLHGTTIKLWFHADERNKSQLSCKKYKIILFLKPYKKGFKDNLKKELLSKY